MVVLGVVAVSYERGTPVSDVYQRHTFQTERFLWGKNGYSFLFVQAGELVSGTCFPTKKRHPQKRSVPEPFLTNATI